MAELTASLEQLRGARADRRTGGGSSGGFSFDDIGNLLDRDKQDASGLLDRIFARKRDR
jgi:hypothetical protein